MKWTDLVLALTLILFGVVWLRLLDPAPKVPQEVWSANEVVRMMPPPETITVCGDHGAVLWCHTN